MRDMELLEQVQQLRHRVSFFQVKADRMGPVQPWEEMTERGLIIACQYLKEECQGDGARLCWVGLINRTRGSGQQLMHGKFHLNRVLLRKNFFTAQWPCTGTGCTERLWSLPYGRHSRIVWTQSCAMCSGMAMLEQGGWTRWPTGIPSNMSHSVVLWSHRNCAHLLFFRHISFGMVVLLRIAL